MSGRNRSGGVFGHYELVPIHAPTPLVTSKVYSNDFSIGTRIDEGWCELATDTQQRFVERALRRKKLFLTISIVGMVIACVLAAYSGFRRLNDPTFPIESRAVIVVLILLNSRQNLRQYRFASFIEDYKKEEV